jgi:hypothetical protein
MLFSEAESYRRFNTLFGKTLKKEYEDDLVETVANAEANVANLAAEAVADPELQYSEEAQQAAAGIADGSKSVVERMDTDKVVQSIQDGADKPMPTLLLEKDLEGEFDDVHMMFGDYYLSEMIDNLLAGGRYQLQDIDTSLEKIAFRDRVTRQFLEDLNTIMEDAIDEQIYDEEYFLKYPLPYLYRRLENPNPRPISCVGRDEAELVGRYENFYRGRNAVDVLEYPELSITR